MIDSLVSDLGRASRFLQRELQNGLEPFGLGLGEFRVVGLLMDEPTGLTQNALCERLGVTAPTLSVAVGALERRGVVERRPDPQDGRRKRVVLAQGAPLEPVQQMLGRVEERITACVSAQELATARRVLAKVSEVLETQREGSPK